MIKLSKIFAILLLVGLYSCEEEPVVVEDPINDTSPPEIYDFRWIDSPFYENDIGGPIIDGENYTLTISDGFQYILKVRDETNIAEGELYMLVNNDESLRETFLSKDIILDFKEGSFGYYFRVPKIALGSGVFYDLKPGDKYYFYLRFEDELGQETTMQWTADLVE